MLRKHVNNQHTVPRCFLKNFSEDGNSIFRKFKRVDSKELRNKELNKPISLKSATVEDNFYTVKNADDPMLVETIAYAEHIENPYPQIYSKLIDENVKYFTMEERTRLLMFFLSMYSRTPLQFNFFLGTIPADFQHELHKIKEDYKAVHLLQTVIKLMEVHEFKIFTVAKIIDTSQFITSDNPVLLLSRQNELQNFNFDAQFNYENDIFVPIDPKHCFILSQAKDKNGIDLNGKVFYNLIHRVDVDISFTQIVNLKMMSSADKCYFGTKIYLTS